MHSLRRALGLGHDEWDAPHVETIGMAGLRRRVAAHIVYGHFRLGNPPRVTAMDASLAAALGAGGLAVAANLHEWMRAASYTPSIAIALFAWPLLTVVPAFVLRSLPRPS